MTPSVERVLNRLRLNGCLIALLFLKLALTSEKVVFSDVRTAPIWSSGMSSVASRRAAVDRGRKKLWLSKCR